MFLPAKHLLSAFYKTLLSKNPSKNLVFNESPYRRLLRTLLRSVLLHDPLGVHPYIGLTNLGLAKCPTSYHSIAATVVWLLPVEAAVRLASLSSRWHSAETQPSTSCCAGLPLLSALCACQSLVPAGEEPPLTKKSSSHCRAILWRIF